MNTDHATLFTQKWTKTSEIRFSHKYPRVGCLDTGPGPWHPDFQTMQATLTQDSGLILLTKSSLAAWTRSLEAAAEVFKR